MVIGISTLTIPSPWNHHGRHCLRPTPPLIKCESGGVPLTKQAHRFFSSLTSTAAVDDPAIANRLIKKFVASSPKSIALNALSHLLSPRNSHPHLSAIAFPMYTKISEASWYNWNPKLVADLVPLLDKQGKHDESQALISQVVSKLKFKERDLVQFYCNLIESCSKHESKQGFNDAYGYLSELVNNSSSMYVKKQGYKSMVSSLCELGQPNEAENVVEDMIKIGVKPSLFELRFVLYGYGKMGFFEDMERMVKKMETEGFGVDTISSNMILSSYGAYNALPKMVPWLQKMKALEIPFSIRTYNCVLNSCPMIMSFVRGSGGFPVSVSELVNVLDEDEALLVKELVESSSVLDEAMEWDDLELKLDLHGMHSGSAYLIMLQWIEEMKSQFRVEECVVPAQITVVCGTGKHSSVRGESPVKTLIKAMMVQMKSPMRIDRKNIGCFIAKGQVVRNWLIQSLD
ncbi:pentatricopeptide repeat-containing protein [Gossypium australe]|uniref:Pentatricopeptide repeat-containing protein n=1 Tax=Gossypium australe TaxID=47621 RepID=A0A5B6WMH4_9ROSI|nr:pentatricopeptide repeat-containing protein [Gossypium australe]